MKKWGVLIVLISFVALIMGFLLFQGSKVSAQATATYVGIDKCKTCHAQQFKDYEKRKFSKAWSVLVMRGKNKDPECLKCHTTGYGQGGFVSEETTPHLKYKQCEACHGPGSIHASNPGNAEVREGMKMYTHKPDDCTKCHRGVIAHRIGVTGF